LTRTTSSFFRKARKGLLAGLILPLLVVLGLVLELKASEGAAFCRASPSCSSGPS